MKSKIIRVHPDLEILLRSYQKHISKLTGKSISFTKAQKNFVDNLNFFSLAPMDLLRKLNGGKKKKFKFIALDQ